MNNTVRYLNKYPYFFNFTFALKINGSFSFVSQLKNNYFHRSLKEFYVKLTNPWPALYKNLLVELGWRFTDWLKVRQLVYCLDDLRLGVRLNTFLDKN